MAFPQTPLDARLEFLIDGAWEPVPTYERDGIEIETGLREQGAVADPGSLTITINNRNGRYSPRNPESDLYGKIGRNTRCRLSVPGTESYLELDGSRDSTATTPNDPVLNIAGDLDLRWEGEADWYAGGAQILIGKWGAAGQRAYHLRLWDGWVYANFTTDGTGGVFAGRALPALPRHAALRVTFDANNGAGGSVIRFYWAETLDGPWTQVGTDATIGLAVTIPATTSPLTIAPYQDDAVPVREPVTGRCYRAEVRNGIDGTIVAAPDFRNQLGGTAAFVDAAGRSWTVTGTASIRDRDDLFNGEIPEWPQHWTPDGSDAWVPIQAAGVLRRMGQGRKALQSTLRRRLPSGSPLAYWPMEDGAAATRAASALDGGQPLVTSGLQYASEDSLPSSDALPVLDDAATLRGIVPGAAAGGWHVEMVYKLDALPATEQTMLRVLLSPGTGGVHEVRVRVSAATIKVEALDESGAVVAWFPNTDGRADFTGVWNRLQVFSSVSGAQTYMTLAWRNVITGVWWYVNAPWTGTPGRLTSVRGSWGSDFQGMAIGHLSAWDTGGTSPTSPGVTIYEGSDDGYTGETAWARMQRLADEENLPLARVPGPETTQQVGPQTIDTLLNLLQAAADADGGLLLEDRRRPGLLFRERSSMYSQEPALTLSYDQAPGLAAPFTPVDDDTAVRNDRTVTRDGGSEGRAVLEEGPLSVQDPPDGIGLYDDSVTLSLYTDAQTEPIAYWRLHLGTHDGPRYPSVRVMLHKAPNLIPDVLALAEGDLIRITGLPKWVGYGDVDLLVDGIRHDAGLQHWEVEFTCSPGEPWRVAAVEDTLLGRVDTDGSELAAAVDADDQELSVLVTDGAAWVTANPVLNANPDFATDLANWAGFGAALERVEAGPDAPFTGEWALQLTPDGVSEFPNAGSEQVPVVVGTQYVVSGWLRCARARSVALNLNWFDGAGYLSTSANDQPVEAGEWTWFEMTATAPAGATAANIAPTVAPFPPTTDVLLAHQVTIRAAGGSPQDFPFNIRAGGEEMTVTAITGAASPQTFIVQRSANGIVKAHVPGTAVRFAQPAIVAL